MSNDFYFFRFSNAIKLLLLLLTDCSLSFAQTYNVKHYTLEDGIASSIVYVAYQDSKGYMWLGTAEGVNRFDGRKFQVFTIEDGLSDNDVLRIIEDRSGRVWFLTYNGHISYYAYSDAKIHNETTDPFLKDSYTAAGMTFAYIDSRNRVWISGTSGSLCMIDKNTIIKIPFPQTFIDGGICVDESSEGEIFIFRNAEKFLFDELTYTAKPLGRFANPKNGTFFLTGTNAVYYSNDEGVCKIQQGREMTVLNSNEININDVITATEDEEGHIYVSTGSDGVICISPDNSKPDVKHYLKNKPVNSVTIDSEGNIWFMTRGEGVYMLPVNSRNARTFFDNSDVFSIKKYNDSICWAATFDYKLLRLKGTDTVTVNLPDNGKGKTNINLIEINKNNLWCCTGKQFFKIILDESGMHIKKFSSIKEFLGKTIGVSFNKNGDACVILNYGIGFIKKSGDDSWTYNILPLNEATGSKRKYAVFYDSADNLYFSNIDGLMQKTDSGFTYLGQDNILLRSRIVCIMQADDSTLLLSTDGNGIIFFRNGKVIRHYSVADGLASGICRRISSDHDKFFVSTNRGLTEFRWHNDIASDFLTYTINDGLISNDVREVAIMHNHIYAATAKGISELTEKNYPVISEKAPPLYITSVHNNQHALTWDKPIAIPFNSNELAIKFIAITFGNPRGVQYQYKLGDGNNWITTSTSQLNFPGIAPGNYTFSVRARKQLSGWSLPVSFSFTVTPPFYLTWWFASALALLFLAVFALIIIFINRKKYRREILALEKKHALDMERNRISADMHDDLGGDLSKIAVLAEIIKVKSEINGEIIEHVSKISNYAKSSQKKMDDIIWALNPFNDSMGNLSGYINQYCLNYFDGTGTSVKMINGSASQPAVEVSARLRRNVFLVVKEISNNTLKHAQATYFFINIKITDEKLLLELSDNGRGFNTNDKKTLRNGLKNIEKRVNEMKGSLTVVSDEGEGTKYNIKIPLFQF